MSVSPSVDGEGLVIIPPELLALATEQEREKYRLYLISKAVQADEWEGWLKAMAPAYAVQPFGDHHARFWQWAWGIEKGERPRPFVAIWPRGGAKSTSAEMCVLSLGARHKRGYCLYVSETQDQADDHVANIAALLEGNEVEFAYPELGERMLGKFGTAKGWRRNRIRTGSGFTVDAIGLDSAARGIKLENMRPDLMVFDDIDSEQDSEAMTEKKIKTITRKLLPAGSQDCAVLAIQNKVHDDSIFARLADNRADFLRDRIVSGPIPAVWDLEWAEIEGKFQIVGGTPAWDGMPLKSSQGLLNDIGLTAFLAECQHATVTMSGGIFDHINWSAIHVTEAELPVLRRACVWLDPAVTSTDNSDRQGIQCDALGTDGLIYRLWSWEGRTQPLDAVKRAIKKALEWDADTVGIESDQGGDTWRSVYHQACDELRSEGVLTRNAPRFASAKAGAGHGSKMTRAQRMLVDYERNKIRHLVGTHDALEMALMRFPKVKPFDLTDASYWAWHDLTRRGSGRGGVRSAAGRAMPEFRMN
jgi:hypothetical protein